MLEEKDQTENKEKRLRGRCGSSCVRLPSWGEGGSAGHSPPHYQFDCVGEDAVQSQGQAGSWKATEVAAGGVCPGGAAGSLSR